MRNALIASIALGGNLWRKRSHAGPDSLHRRSDTRNELRESPNTRRPRHDLLWRDPGTGIHCGQRNHCCGERMVFILIGTGVLTGSADWSQPIGIGAILSLGDLNNKLSFRFNTCFTANNFLRIEFDTDEVM